MTKEPFREDDLLSYFGVYLRKCGFLILALSGNQQGRYWFPIEKYRKAPDIIAFRSDIVLVGEAKVKSRELFKATHGQISDYQALQYLLNNETATQQLTNMIQQNLHHLNISPTVIPALQAIVVGGDSFEEFQHQMTDNRIWYFSVDKETGLVLNRDSEYPELLVIP